MNNKTKLFLGGLALLLTEASSYAMPGMEILQEKIAKSAESQPQGKNSPTTCVDFSGEWKGKCTANGTTTEQNVSIKQEGCEVLKGSGFETTRIGSLDSRTHYESVQDKSYSYVISYANDWVSNATQLKTQFAGLIKIGERLPVPANGSGIMGLEAGKLVYDFEMSNLKVNCLFEKQ